MALSLADLKKAKSKKRPPVNQATEVGDSPQSPAKGKGDKGRSRPANQKATKGTSSSATKSPRKPGKKKAPPRRPWDAPSEVAELNAKGVAKKGGQKSNSPPASPRSEEEEETSTNLATGPSLRLSLPHGVSDYFVALIDLNKTRLREGKRPSLLLPFGYKAKARKTKKARS